MRNFIGGSIILILPSILIGCGSNAGTKPATLETTAAEKITDSKSFIMQSGGVDVLKLTTSADTNAVPADGTLRFNPGRQFEVNYWIVPGAKTVDEATGQVATIIVSQFRDFKPTQTSDLTIAGSPAKRLIGSGHEADDGDPGAADVVVFKVGDHVFIACNHGESLDPPTQERMLKTVQTAQVP